MKFLYETLDGNYDALYSITAPWAVIFAGVLYLGAILVYKLTLEPEDRKEARPGSVKACIHYALISVASLAVFLIFTRRASVPGWTGIHRPLDEKEEAASWIFVLLKYIELFDTYYQMKRRWKIVFLHYWHHFSVLFVASATVTEFSTAFIVLAGMNAFVHVLTYAYYALGEIGALPRVRGFVRDKITLTQITQFIMGTIYSAWLFSDPSTCKRYPLSLLSLGIYVTYLALFISWRAKFKTKKE